MAVNNEEYINKMYDSSLESQKQSLAQDYASSLENLDAQQEKAQKQTDENLNRTYVEAAKQQKNYGEVQNAYGLTSGAMAQARLAMDNQLQSDLTTIRAAQQSTDAEVERQRGILAKEYSSAITKAQADNDLQRAQALYEAAQQEEEALLQKQQAAAKLMAGVGDYSLYSQLYGLTPEQLAKLQGNGKSVATGSRGNTGSQETTSTVNSDRKAENFVNNMLANLTSSRADPSRIISGTNYLTKSQKEYAQAYLKQVLANGAMKKKK